LRTKPQYLLILCLSFLFVACDEKEPISLVEAPENYVFERNGESTVSFEGQTTRISMATELVEAMTLFNTNTELLLQMYRNQTLSGEDANPFSDPQLNQSVKSIKSKVAASQDFFSSNTVESAQIKADLESWLTSQVTEVFPNQNKIASPGIAGQIADGSTARYVSPKGLEYNQVVNKALIGSLMVDQMLNNYLGLSVLDEASNIDDNDNKLLEDGKSYTSMEHKWDEAYGYMFGANEVDFTNPIAANGEDSFLHKYLNRVDEDEDFNGIANDIFQAFKLGRAAIVANDYQLRNDQIEVIREKVSEVIGIRAVYYLQQGKLALESNNLGAMFHDLSEGLGFVYSLRFTSEVDSFMDQLTEGNGFWDLKSSTLNQISEEIASRFKFTLEQAAN